MNNLTDEQQNIHSHCGKIVSNLFLWRHWFGNNSNENKLNNLRLNDLIKIPNKSVEWELNYKK